MEPSGLFNTTFKMLEKNLDLRTRKHNLITSNIANMDTPNYKPFNIEVDEAMERLTSEKTGITLAQTDRGHIDASGKISGLSEGVIEEAEVDIDKTMMDLSENSILFNASAQILSKKYQFLRQAINGGNQ